jgi:NAD(P)-dependent dehydrogenase (short-subunit alcohol dehydrogenase family)
MMARTAVITGASSGVGRAAAIELASLGWNVIALGRDPARSADALAAIRAAAHADAQVAMITGDLALLSDVARMADEVLALTGRIHALCNNAGGVRPRMELTAEGNEATFAGNHLGHFLLTRRLLPALREAAREEGPGGARVIAVSSEGHRQAPPFDWADLQGTGNWISGRTYCLAKLCNLLFTQELARRHAADGIVAHGMHPGEAATNFASHAVPEMQTYMATLDMIPPEVGGHTLAWLASSAEAGRGSGGYYFDCALLDADPAAHDAALAARLWAESEALLARAGY